MLKFVLISEAVQLSSSYSHDILSQKPATWLKIIYLNRITTHIQRERERVSVQERKGKASSIHCFTSQEIPKAGN